MNYFKHLSCALALVLLGGLARAEVATPQTLQLDIPAQPVADALNEFARQSGLQVLVDWKDSNGLKSPRLIGTYTAEDALKRLLADSGLTYQYLDARTVSVRRVQTGQSGHEGASMDEQAAAGLRMAQAGGASGNADTAGIASGGDATHEGKLEEVVVTAQKRQERLKDVPISITAMSGVELDKSTFEGVAEALNTVPGVTTIQTMDGMGGASVVVRGVSAPLFFSGSTPIAYYVDSVPFGLVRSGLTPDANAYDLERVEVLRGPQGTLYGASALNGVVRILTKDANPNAFEFKMRGAGSATEGGGDNYRADLSANIPLVEGKLGARVTAGYQDTSGWIDRPNDRNANDAHLGNLRLKVKAQPSDKLTIDLSSWLVRNNYLAPNTGDAQDRNVSLVDEPSFAHYNAHGLKIGYDLSSFTVTSASSYLDFGAEFVLDYVPFCGPVFCNTTLVSDSAAKVFTEELTASSNGTGPWRWSAGAFYRDGRETTVQVLPGFPPAVNHEAFDDNSESYAVYGELTRRLLDGRLELTGGLREFHDHVTFFDVSPAGTVGGNDNFHALSPRVVLTWHQNDNLMLYTSYSKGFRSGLLQGGVAVAAGVPPAKPDTLINYEIGAKAGSKMWSFDTAVYYMDWRDVQQNLSVSRNNTIYAGVYNGPSASGVGFEGAVTLRPVTGLSFGVTLSVNDLKMDADVISGSVVKIPEGGRLAGSPKETYGVFAEYGFALGGGGYSGHLSASANYISKMATYGDPGGGNPIVTDLSEPQRIGRASFAIRAPRQWEATLFVDNLTNSNAVSSPGLFGLHSWDTRPRPRTYGLQLEYRFD